MIFNSLEFFIFFFIVIALYWKFLSKNLAARNLFILVVSYVFYGWWDWRFLSLIAFSSLVDFLVGFKLGKTEKTNARKWLLACSVFVNLGLLFTFKYFNFFAESLVDLLRVFQFDASYTTLHIVLPVGISFYTFQTMSYTIDIYKKSIPAERNPITFFAFVSFFPQLVAGPIERASNLLPQFHKKNQVKPDEIRLALRQILWGFFKKVAIADQLAPIVDRMFTQHGDQPTIALWLGAFYFSVQIYCDFSGYSDIAIGVARLLGFKLMTNFRFPYFSRSISEFWSRWHISLSTWFRDYVYIPLGGNREGLRRHLRNILYTFMISGLWHGANWTFIVWGLLNGLYHLPMIIFQQAKYAHVKFAQKYILLSKNALAIPFVFLVTTITWIFFRADSIQIAFSYVYHLFDFKKGVPIFSSIEPLPWVILLAISEYFMSKLTNPFSIDRIPTVIRWIIYLLLALVISKNYTIDQSFIYFQF